MHDWLTGLVCGAILGWVARYAYVRHFRLKQVPIHEPKHLRSIEPYEAVIGAKDGMGSVEPATSDLTIEVTDWGPTFTGENGSLHRWRWSVWTTLPYSSMRERGGDIVGIDVPHILGNAPFMHQAVTDARLWIIENFPYALYDVVATNAPLLDQS